jgi:hypothetical protein
VIFNFPSFSEELPFPVSPDESLDFLSEDDDEEEDDLLSKLSNIELIMLEEK